MRVKWLSLLLALMPLVVNANQNVALPDIEFLEFLGSYSSEEQTWLDLAMEEEQQQMKTSNDGSVPVGDIKHD